MLEDDDEEYDDDIDESILDNETEEVDEQQEELEEDTSLFSQLKVTKGKKYFDEEYVSDLIINKYQPFLEYGLNKKGKRVCTNRENAPQDVCDEIMANLLLIANAIINKYKYWRFEPVEDLRAEALRAMYQYLPNFQPGKGSAFDLFSIICKRHLLNYTYKNYKHRDTADVDEFFDIAQPREVHYDLFLSDLETTFLDIINRHYIKEQRKEYIELTAILMNYLVKNKAVLGKNDLLSEFKSFGYKSTQYKKFIEEISKYKNEFYSLLA